MLILNLKKQMKRNIWKINVSFEIGLRKLTCDFALHFLESVLLGYINGLPDEVGGDAGLPEAPVRGEDLHVEDPAVLPPGPEDSVGAPGVDGVDQGEDVLELGASQLPHHVVEGHVQLGGVGDAVQHHAYAKSQKLVLSERSAAEKASRTTHQEAFPSLRPWQRWRGPP